MDDRTDLLLKLGQVLLGRYRLVKIAGRGGMGVVYQAEDLNFDGRPVAIKALPPEMAHSARDVEQIRAEAMRLREIHHPHIVSLLDFGRDPDRADIAVLIMQWAEGKTLDTLIGEARSGMAPDQIHGLPMNVVAKIARPIAEAIDYLHTRKILHRDIKPSNIMIRPDGSAQLLDFGIAREVRDTLNRVSMRDGNSGCIPYMSPQQLDGEDEPSNDIYSFAATLYEAMSGHPPFRKGAITEQIKSKAPAPLLGLPPAVNAALLAGLAKKAEARPATATELIDRMRSEIARGGVKRILALVVGALGLALLGLWSAGVFAQRVAPVDLASARSDALQRWERVALFEKGDGVGSQVDQVQREISAAQTLIEMKEYTEALAKYRRIVTECDRLAAVDTDRTGALDARRQAEGASKATEGAGSKTIITTLRDSALAKAKEGSDQYSKGRFKEAAASWSSAKELFVGSREIGAARACFNDALKSYGPEVVLSRGGSDWVAVNTELERAQSSYEVTKLSVTYYDNAIALLPAAARSAADAIYDDAKKAKAKKDATTAARLFQQAADLYQMADSKLGEKRPPLALQLFQHAQCLQKDNNPAGDWNRAAKLYAQAAALRGDAGDKSGQATSLHQQAWCLQKDNNPGGDWDRAAKLYEQVAALQRGAGDKSGQATSLDQQAWCLEKDNNPAGDWDRAAQLYEQAAALQRDAGDKSGQAASLHRQAWCLRKDNNPAGDWDHAAQLYEQAAALQRDAGDKSGQAASLHQQAGCLQKDNNPAGDWDRAAQLYAQAAALRGDTGDKRWQGLDLSWQAWCLQKDNNPAGDWDRAAKLFEQAAALQGDAGDKSGQGKSLSWQARCLEKGNSPAGDWNRAAKLYEQAAALKGDAGEKSDQATYLHRQAGCLQKDNNPAGDWDRAAQLYAQAAALRGDAGDKSGQATSLHQQAVCLIRGGKSSMTTEARRLFEHAVQLRTEAGDLEGARRTRSWIE